MRQGFSDATRTTCFESTLGAACVPLTVIQQAVWVGAAAILFAPKAGFGDSVKFVTVCLSACVRRTFFINCFFFFCQFDFFALRVVCITFVAVYAFLQVVVAVKSSNVQKVPKETSSASQALRWKVSLFEILGRYTLGAYLFNRVTFAFLRDHGHSECSMLQLQFASCKAKQQQRYPLPSSRVA